jgi:anti-sigma factor RsiW
VACETWRANLDRYLDGELAPADAADFSAHLRSCADCTGEILQRVQIRRLVHSAGKRYTPSAEFRNKIGKQFASKPRRARFSKWSIVFVPALVLLAAALLLSSYFDRQQKAEQEIFSELADLHVATLASSTPVDVLSSDRHTVKPWFQGKIPFTFNLPELAGTEFSLLGGRVFYLHQTPGAHLIYQVRKHEISVFILPDSAGTLKSLTEGTASVLTFNTDTWTENGLRYFVVGDANAGDLQTLAKLLQGAG